MEHRAQWVRARDGGAGDGALVGYNRKALNTPASSRVGYHFPAFLLYVALTWIMVYPVVAGFSRVEVPGWEGDNFYYVRSMWWMKHALFDLGVSPFFDPTAYYPVGHSLARSELTTPNTILALPITMTIGPEAAYNSIILFSFVATGFFGYLWVLRLTGSRPAALLAGTIVAFMPFRFAHLPGHLPQLTTQWLVLTLYAFELFLERRTLGRAALLGSAVALSALGSWYYGYALGLIVGTYAIARTWGSPVWRERAWWTGIGTSVVVAVALMLPVLVEMLKLSSAGALDRSLMEMQSWALNFYDPFIPNVKHMIWGERAARAFPQQATQWVERLHTLGVVAVLLAAIGFWTWRKRNPRIIWALAIAWVVSYLIALGPFLKSGDAIVRVPAPRVVAEFAGQIAGGAQVAEVTRGFVEVGVPVPLPSVLLYKLVPFTKSMRVMARFTVWTAFMTAALAAFGVLTLITLVQGRWGGVAPHVLAAVLIGLVCFESWTEVPVTHVGARAVDLWLAKQPNDVVIVEMPVAQGTRQFQNYWATRHGRRMVFGWAGDSFPAPVERERAEMLNDFPSERSINFLRSVRTTYVLMNPSQIPDWATMERLVNASPGLALDRTLNDVVVYRILR